MQTEPAASPTERIGVYGGTFDPPHLGHLILAETALDSLNLARVLFVPAGEPPHKESSNVRAPVADRVAMVTHAIADNVRFAVSRVDVDRPGPHYSVDMLRLLHDQYPDAELVFMIGGDSLRDLPIWSRPTELLALATLGVMRRPGFKPDLSHLEKHLPGLSARIEWVEAPLIDIASSHLVQCIAQGRSVRYQIPDNVIAYIAQHGLYTTT